MEYLKDLFLNIRIRDILDILIVALAFYKLFMLIRETRAEQLIKGLLILFALTKVSEWLQFHTLNWILDTTMTVGVMAILIVFQPELRRGLEYLGRSRFFTKSFVEIRGERLSEVFDEIVDAVASLSRQKIGALIVIERETGLNEIVETVTLTPEEAKKYHYNPHLLSYDLYGTPDYWFLLLDLNGLSSFTEFDINPIKVYNSNLEMVIASILNQEKESINLNAEEIKV